jgi:uncharacterized protein involved in exopolysaccharide biosynthesis
LWPATYTSSALLWVKPGQFIEVSTDVVNATYARQEQTINSLLLLLKSNDVVLAAVEKIGPQKLYPSGSLLGGLWRVRFMVDDLLWRSSAGSEQLHLAAYASFLALRRAAAMLTVRAEPKSDLIFVAFAHPDRDLARAFIEGLLSSFRDRAIKLSTRHPVASFLASQKHRYDLEFELASAKLSDFSVANSAFLIGEQRQLALKRRSDILAAIAATRGAIIEKSSQATATSAQIAEAKSRTSSPPEQERKEPLSPGAALAWGQKMSNDSPWWLVYQDTIYDLLRLNSEIPALTALVTHQEAELKKTEEELQALAEKEAKFDRLKLEVQQARQTAEQYALLALKEQVGADVSERGFSTIEVAQPATRPIYPDFPNPAIVLPVFLMLGLAIGGWLVTYDVPW